MNILQTIGAGIASLGIFIGGLFGFTPESDPIAYAPEEEALGADTVLPTGIQTYTLAGTGISSTASSFTLTSLTLPQNGYAIQDSDMSDTFYITFEPGSRSRQEFVSCTTIGANTGGNVTISGCTRGLSPLTPYTASTSLRFAHSGGTSVIFSNAPQFYNQYTAKDNDETITGSWLFPSPVAGTNPATKDYVLSVVTGGTVSYDAIAVAGLAGETVATGTIIYLNRTDSRWYKADNDLQSTYVDQTIGIAQGNGTAGNNIEGGILTYGLDSTQVSMTGGNYIFLSATAGATTTATSSQILGKAISATTMFFDPNLIDSATYVPTTFFGTTTASSSARLIGFGNAPSTTIYATAGTYAYQTSASSRWVQVEVVGGGGGGGSYVDTTDDRCGTGGGGGGYSKEIFLGGELSASTTLVVGAAGGVAAAGGSTYFGGTTTASALLYATGGGAGGDQNSSGGGAGGTGVNGDVNGGGSPGDSGAGAQAGSGCSQAGAGGSSMYGTGAADQNVGTNSNATAGSGYGGGGAGGHDVGYSAGSGSAGVVIITEYF